MTIQLRLQRRIQARLPIYFMFNRLMVCSMKVCFLSLDSYPVLTEKNWGYAGGAEVEQVHLGRELIKRGYDVSFVTYHHGSVNVENVQSVEIIKTYSRHKAMELSGCRKFRSVWASLRKAKANLYFHESGATGVLPSFCCLNRKRFIYRIPSDATVMGRALSGNYTFRKKFADLLEIKTANAVVAQNSFQKDILSDRFKVESVVIKNGVEIPPPCKQKNDPPIVLWVGRITQVKRPQLFVALAEAIPYAYFEIIGGKTDGEYDLYNELKRKALDLPNLGFRGFVPYHDVNRYFQRASLLVNTSSIEAFPITFIQAWANHAPVVSLSVDPDHVIQNEKIGFHAGTTKQLLSDVELLLKDNKLRKTMGMNARNYVKREHDIRKVVREYIEIFDDGLES